MSNSDSFKEEEEEEYINDLLLDETSFVTKNFKPPIDTFVEGEYKKLPENIKMILKENVPPDIDMLVDIIFDMFSISIKYDTLYRIIRDSKLIKTFEAPVMESTRAEVPLEVIEQHYTILNNVFKATNVPPCFVLNVDESGFIDFVDVKKHTVVLPADAPEDYVLSIKSIKIIVVNVVYRLSPVTVIFPVKYRYYRL